MVELNIDVEAPRWDGDVRAARALQSELAGGVKLRDAFPKKLETIAGFDVGFRFFFIREESG